MENANFRRQADKIAKRLGNYECEGQMSIFDVDWNSIVCKEENQNNQRYVDEMEPDFPF